MTTRGESAPEPRPRRSRTIALLSALAVSAAFATWAEVHYAGSDSGASGAAGVVSQDNLAMPADNGQPVSAPSGMPGEATSVLPATVDIPVTATNPNAFQATRYALDTKTSCADVLASTLPAGTTSSCQGYLTASYVSTDHSLLASVTVLTFPDVATAKRVKPQLTPSAATSFREPGGELPGVTANPVSVQSRVEQVGRYVTVVQAAYAQGATQNPAEDLSTPVWFLSAQVADTVVWDA
jgi:hypothetical protein